MLQHFEPLTAREREIVALLVGGLAINDLAGRLTIAPSTVGTHMRNIHRKTATHHLAGLLAWAHENPEAWREPAPPQRRQRRAH